MATWLACQRKWAYSRQRPRTTNQWAEFGTRAHALIEGWLVDRKAPDPSTPEGACVVPALAHLPAPGSDLAVEVPIDFQYENVAYVGYADLVYGYRPREIVVVHDHKSTGDLKWAKTPEDLVEDPQRITYSHALATKLDVEHVLAVWGYMQRKPPRPPRLVPVLEHRDAIAVRFERLHRRAGLPIVQAHGLPPEQLPRDLSHCSAFGGCPYRAECHANLAPAEIAVAALKRAS
jgi:hypothetical protein